MLIGCSPEPFGDRSFPLRSRLNQATEGIGEGLCRGWVCLLTQLPHPGPMRCLLPFGSAQTVVHGFVVRLVALAQAPVGSGGRIDAQPRAAVG